MSLPIGPDDRVVVTMTTARVLTAAELQQYLGSLPANGWPPEAVGHLVERGVVAWERNGTRVAATVAVMPPEPPAADEVRH
jgi:hypothetical protein